ncbi:MAG: tetratricopeptide repeat protein [Candidatus Eremiobacteraeota bacterium]|nr:tetratricopeptide repeat protein [Candidatus Eremiobacteraeota bacterium]
MNSSKHRKGLEKALKDVDSRLRGRPLSLELKYERARILDRLGRAEEARQAYVEILQREGAHFGALNDLGLLLFRAGRRAEALVCFNAAVAKHPNNAIGRANLGLVLLRGGDAAQAKQQYEIALQLDPGNAETRRGLSLALDALGESERAQSHREAGFAATPIVQLPYRGEGRPTRVLLIVSASPGNVPTDRFLDDRTFSVAKLVAEYYRPTLALPAHDVIFNAVGDADICQPALEAASAILRRSGAPAINSPEAVAATGRIANAARLRELPDTVVPRAFALARSSFERGEAAAEIEARGFAYPVLLRTPGFHAGAHLERVTDANRLAETAARLPGEELFVIEFADGSAADATFRKYRAIFVGERIFPLHLAISSQWKVHYFSADMSDRADYRALEAAFLHDMPAVLGEKAMRSLEGVRRMVGLDYGGIDFGIDREGRAIVFEANATMIVPAPQDEAQWAYRREAIAAVESAVIEMLLDRAATRSRRA